MEKLEWNEKYSVGVKDLDEQHKVIFDLINALSDLENITVFSEELADALTKLMNYLVEHFNLEEKYMREYKYPRYDIQVTQHKKFKKQILKFNLDTIRYKPSVPEDLLEYLKQWFVNHILEEDMLYRDFFIEKGLK